MELTDFSEFKTGRMEPITTRRGDDWAFIPNPFPPQWSVPITMWPTIVKARDRIANLNGIGQTLPDPFLLLRPLQRHEALRSSSLEGTYVSPKELLLFEIDKSRRAGKDQRVSEWREVYNYYLALQKGRSRIKNGSIDNQLVRTLQKILMQGTRGEEKAPGQFRDCQVYVGSDHRYNPPPHSFLPEAMDNLELAYQGPPDGIDPLVYAFMVHYQFEAVHPFCDGNGRIGRLVLSLTIFDWLNLSEPWLYLSEYFEKNRTEYIRRLYRISTGGEWEEWIAFCLEGAIQEADSATRRCTELRSLKEKYQHLVGRASTRMHEIIDGLFSTPVLDAPVIRKKFGVAYPTAKSDIQKLIDADILTPIENTYPQAYCASEIMQIAFD